MPAPRPNLPTQTWCCTASTSSSLWHAPAPTHRRRPAGVAQGAHPPDWRRKERARNLATWHALLLDRLADGEDEQADRRLDRLTTHPALAGPELTFLQARLAHRRGRVDRARSLVHDSLKELPGHDGFLTFAQEIGAPLPPRAQEKLDERVQFGTAAVPK